MYKPLDEEYFYPALSQDKINEITHQENELLLAGYQYNETIHEEYFLDYDNNCIIRPQLRRRRRMTDYVKIKCYMTDRVIVSREYMSVLRVPESTLY
jgi:hypothetical protein